MNRIPFREHCIILFVCGIIIFMFAALLRYYKTQATRLD